MLDREFFTKLGANVRDKYRKHIFAKARDVYSKSFKGYTQDYKKYKSKGDNFRQDRNFANTHAPVFTGDLLRDYSLIKTMKNGFQIGWTKDGAKVEWLKKMGRVLTSPDQPLPRGIIQYIQTQANGYIKKRLGPNKTTTYRIGKK